MNAESAHRILNALRLSLGPRRPEWILHGHCIDKLRELPTASASCCVTSPPYWGLRDYGLDPVVWDGNSACKHEWGEAQPCLHPGQVEQTINKITSVSKAQTTTTTGQFCVKCGAWLGCLGLEPTPQLYIKHLVDVFREVRRVLRPDGTLWLNLGDTYCSTGPGTMGDPIHQRGLFSGVKDETAAARRKYRPETPLGMKPKDLVGIPWMVAFALRNDGWYLRMDNIWAKSISSSDPKMRCGTCMPEAVTDRPTRAHEYLFLLTPSARYFYDIDAIREPNTINPNWNYESELHKADVDQGYFKADGRDNTIRKQTGGWSGLAPAGPNGDGRNKRSVWFVNPKPYKGAHFATFPPDLIVDPIKAGTSEHGCCSTCGAPWERIKVKAQQPNAFGAGGGRKAMESEQTRLSGGIGRMDGGRRAIEGSTFNNNPRKRPSPPKTIGWRPTCDCPDNEPRPAIVLDPFFGSGTTGVVSRRLGRGFVGIDANLKYCNELAQKRVKSVEPGNRMKRVFGSV